MYDARASVLKVHPQVLGKCCVSDALAGVAALDPAEAAGRVEGVDRRHQLDRRDTGPKLGLRTSVAAAF